MAASTAMTARLNMGAAPVGRSSSSLARRTTPGMAGQRLPVRGAGEFSTILADQVKSHSWQDRQSEFILRVGDGVLAEVRAKIRALLSL
jgi:hypothetical protein